MLNLSAAFSAMTTRTVMHERDGAESYDADGYLVPGQTASTQIAASVQPVSAREYQNLPEGIRDEADAIVYTRHPLKSGDRIMDRGARYRVLSDDDWQALGGYSKAALGSLR